MDVKCETNNMNNKKKLFEELTTCTSESSTSSIIEDMTFISYVSKKNERNR